ncbi:MAG TPA: flagellar biosynthesis protein FlhF [Woeseiaceae bacterium]|nr:flagellar biosynthesis protein FlhF [Woeseiaceae bacterium]
MKIKRYLDKDMRRVLRQVREEQGPDAVILSNRRVEQGIEVIAAIDYDEALMRHAIGGNANASGVFDAPAAIIAANLPSQVPGRTPAVDDLADDDDVIDRAGFGGAGSRSVKDELSSLRGMLETQMAGLIWKDTAEKSPLRAQMLRNLARLGVAADIANSIVDQLEPVDDVRRLWHAPLMSLAKMVPVHDDALLQRGGVIALLGPTGVGKTTTIAKLAARYAMRNGDDGIALVSADVYRIGAREHLTAFANIIGAKVYSASSPEELSALLTELGSKRLVLIDTEGRSPRDRELAKSLAAYGSNQDRVKFYLTLSAASQEAVLDEAIREFRKVPLEGCIVTKLDEAAQLGSVVSALIRNDLPACWFSDGQQIPDDLYPAARKRMWLINQAVACLEHHEPVLDDRFMATEYVQRAAAHA